MNHVRVRGPRLVLLALLLLPLAAGAAEIRFNRDIRPILSDHCFHCHGPDASTRKAKLRLDTREGAVALRGSEPAAIVSGHPEQSSLMERVLSSDPDEIMPPPDLKKPLRPDQIELLQAWIRAGAPYEGHWAYEPIERPAPPEPLPAAGWSEHPIDRFIGARLRARGLPPSPEADRRTLYRRLSLDLTGLPPKPEDIDAFVADPRPRALEEAVDRLLQSPAYGERMAVFWLDLVRYADTVGYHGDQDFKVWPYRDYVIRAFNENRRFDQFTIENLAGDLLPNATTEQRVASGYNRLLMITAEGGAQDREYRAKYAADRVRNVSTVWLGVTLGCAECHDHKYDPFTAKDFYSFSAFFADLKEKGFYDRGYPAGDWGSSIQLPSPEQAAQREALQTRIGTLERTLNTSTPELVAAQATWEEGLRAAPIVRLGDWSVAGPFPAGSLEEAHRREFGPETQADPGATFLDGKVKWAARPELKDGAVHTLSGDNAATYLQRTLTVDADQELSVSLGSDDALKLWVNGAVVVDKLVQRGVAPDQDQAVLRLKKGENRLLLKISNGGGGYGFYFQTAGPAPADLLEIARTEPAQRSPEAAARLAAHFRGRTPLLDGARQDLTAAKKELEQLEASLPTMLVSEALPEPAMTRVLRRGNWLDDGGDVVAPAVPHFLPGATATPDRRLTRRDLAEWIMAKDNPLTARVFVNRLWKQYFGLGLSRKLEDIGAQGEWPSHPELLDWLASEFRDSGWNIKHMVRLLVTSAAYRQSSRADERLREADPDNRLLARQSAVRLDAEFIRDGALFVSGLLVEQIGGASVKPYQPAGYYSQLNFPKREYEADQGNSQYRRGLYTHWQRTFLHPSLASFDAPTREECTAERVRSNTPQQALVLLNDPTYVEAARALAERILREGGATFADRVNFGFRQALGRTATEDEIEILRGLHASHEAQWAAAGPGRDEFLGVGQRPVPANLSRTDLAAWTSVARAILNLHETITRS